MVMASASACSGEVAAGSPARACAGHVRRARALLGTFVEIAAAGPAARNLDAAVEAAFAAIAKVHRLMSFHDPASDVSRLNRDAGARTVVVDAWTWQVVDTAADLHRCSHGAFDITVAPVLQELGLLPPPKTHAAPAPGPWRCDAVETLPGRRIRFRHPGTRIDLGGIAKGFAVDRAIEVLRAHRVSAAQVNAGGDLAAFGPKAWSIHIRDPRDPRQTIGAIDITDEALASTGGGFDPFDSPVVAKTAVIDPRARAPARTIAGATVRAPTAMLADALTKVVMIAGEAAAPLLHRFHAGALLVQAGGDIRTSPSWQAARAA
jgi:thiamine biosynthesis lipoprotein